MANYNQLKTDIASVVKTNGNQEITGENLQGVLTEMIDNSVGTGYLYKGIATPETQGGTPDQNVFYLAGAGTYTNFGSTKEIIEGSVGIFKYDGTWKLDLVEILNTGEVFDISAYHATGGELAKYADLTAALGTGGANIPDALRKGGMSVKFVQSSDNKYVLYFLKKNEWSASVSDWEKINLEGQVTQLAVELNGQDTSVTIYENDSLYIENPYGNIKVNSFISDFEVGETYIFSAEGGNLQYKLYYGGEWHSLNRLNENPIEVLWTSDMATSTNFQFYSREGSATTFSVIIKSKGTVISGLKEKVTTLEAKVEIIEEDLSDLRKRNPNTGGVKLYMEGASFVDWNIGFDGDNPSNKGNGWFEMACERLGYVPMNKARSGSSIVDFARGISGNADSQGHKVNAPWTEEEFEQFDTLCIMHVHNYNVADFTVIKESYDGTEAFLNTPLKATARVGYICDQLRPEYYTQAYDYVLKKYAEQCYACKDKVGSRWYGEKMGKPFKVICCTHWHDGRVTFNNAIRVLQEKWGFELCEFDKHIGFCKEQVNPATQAQQSILYCDNGIADTETINGVEFGWHQTRGKDAYIQKQMASIFVNAVLPISYT